MLITSESVQELSSVAFRDVFVPNTSSLLNPNNLSPYLRPAPKEAKQESGNQEA
ncbi:hypothetical protein [Spirosoma sp. KCTC 42546]|uniref:hypothetical protein n=1 Tax=Spirosoma sp. KCTC 42546 TaxID=2520506 RepID=UPI00143CF34F|nr:hypothetical protein [Spirosoma sp. KCTC 42546]